MKTTEKLLLEILLAIVLLIVTALCVNSCIRCRQNIGKLQQIKENELQTIKNN